MCRSSARHEAVAALARTLMPQNPGRDDELRARVRPAARGVRRVGPAERRDQGGDGPAPLRAGDACRRAAAPLELLLPRPRHGAASSASTSRCVEIALDHRTAGLDEVDVAVMDLAERVVDDATSIGDADLQRLRDLGLSETEIMDVVLAAAARCFFSKTLDALGVRPDASYRELEPRAPRGARRRPPDRRRKPASTRSGIASVSATGSPSKRSTASRFAPPARDVLDERRERRAEPVLLRLAQRHERAAAALDEERRLAAEQHDVRARDPGGTGARPLRPRQRRAVGLRGIGGGEHERLGLLAVGGRSSRSRSTAPPSANCAPPSPSTK